MKLFNIKQRLQTYFETNQRARLEEKKEQMLRRINSGSLFIEGDKAYRYKARTTGMLFWKKTKMVKVYE